MSKIPTEFQTSNSSNYSECWLMSQTIWNPNWALFIMLTDTLSNFPELRPSPLMRLNNKFIDVAGVESPWQRVTIRLNNWERMFHTSSRPPVQLSRWITSNLSFCPGEQGFHEPKGFSMFEFVKILSLLWLSTGMCELRRGFNWIRENISIHKCFWSMPVVWNS